MLGGGGSMQSGGHGGEMGRRKAWRRRRGRRRRDGDRGSQSDADECEQVGVVKEEVAVAVGDRTRDAALDERDCQVAEGRHGLGPVAGPGPAAVLVVADVADVVEGLDAPVTAHEAEKVAFACPVQRQAGHAEDDLAALLAVAQQGSALNAKRLSSVGEPEPGDGLGDLNGAGLDAAVALLTLGAAGEKEPSPGRRAAAAWSSGCFSPSGCNRRP